MIDPQTHINSPRCGRTYPTHPPLSSGMPSVSRFAPWMRCDTFAARVHHRGSWCGARARLREWPCVIFTQTRGQIAHTLALAILFSALSQVSGSVYICAIQGSIGALHMWSDHVRSPDTRFQVSAHDATQHTDRHMRTRAHRRVRIYIDIINYENIAAVTSSHMVG